MSEQNSHDAARRIQVGPFNRVEGDLDISLDIDQGLVRSARVNSTLYRGFEQILVGKPAMDALVYTPRICGICSVAQSVACARALASAGGVEITPNGVLSQNLLLANESLTDLLTHFYLFFMPDLARPLYQDKAWFAHVQPRFQAIRGDASREVLPARAGFLHLMGLMAGHWPHSLALQPGGSSKAITRQERLRLITILAEFRRFLERTLFGDDLDVINSLETPQQLQQWQQQQDWQQSDLRTFLTVADDLGFARLGRATDQLLSVGNHPDADGNLLVQAGHWMPGVGTTRVDLAGIREDISHSWMDGPTGSLHPQQGITEVSLLSSEKEHAYSWCKAPRLNGHVVETGALARAVISGRPLATALMQEQGATVYSRMLVRVLELAWIIPQMQQWALQLDPQESFCRRKERLTDGEGVGLIEAARGSLGHWIRLHKGRISHYQIIAPTTWNFSPRDEQGQPGALEQALQGAPVQEGEQNPIAVQHIVRSFDPCMVCTVH